MSIKGHIQSIMSHVLHIANIGSTKVSCPLKCCKTQFSPTLRIYDEESQLKKMMELNTYNHRLRTEAVKGQEASSVVS